MTALNYCISGCPYPEVVAQLCREHLFQLCFAEGVLVALVARILVESLDHKLHGVLQGGGILGVEDAHSAGKERTL